jgi:signal transduction histidine kinase
VHQLWERQEPGANSPEITAELLDRLSKHRTLGAVPIEEREWVVRHGQLRRIDAGEVIGSKAMGIVPGLVILLAGQVGVYVDREDRPERVMGWSAGDVTGFLPYSRMTTPPGPTVAEEATEVVFVHREYLEEMTRTCHEFTSTLVHVMVDRARGFKSSDLQNEQMIKLGTMAAGLAHELNNPASATARSAKRLGDHLAAVEATSREVGMARFTDAELAAIEAMRMVITEPVRQVRSPIEAVQHETDISDWLEEHGADPSTGEALAETAVAIEDLDQLADSVDAERLDVALRWLAEGSAVRRLAREIEQAATQISKLVDAVRKLSREERGAAPGPVNLGESLTQTLDMLRAKALSKSVSISLVVDHDLPRVRGFGSELNQIWSNLITNAIDAVAVSGRVDVNARRDQRRVIVRVVDNGPGIPTNIRERIFDPFFTTKAVGSGTGLGLDIVRRLVQHNDGDIKVVSEPGHTEFQVTLPLADLRTQVAP